MKKFQLWLERKCYSQHLSNLMKIKQSRYPSNLCESHTLLRPIDKHMSLHKTGQSESKRSSVDKPRDFIYCIPEKERRNCKIRMMKSFEVLNDNASRARRIQDVKPVVDTNRQKGTEIVGKRRIFEKKCELSNNELREKNFRQFTRWNNKKMTHFWQRSQLTVSVNNVSRIWKNEFVAMWCELKLKKGWIRSELLSTGQFRGGTFVFLLDERLSEELALKIYTCKGLHSEMIGQFRVSRPEVGEEKETCCRSQDRRTQVQLKLAYSTIAKQRSVVNLR